MRSGYWISVINAQWLCHHRFAFSVPLQWSVQQLRWVLSPGACVLLCLMFLTGWVCVPSVSSILDVLSKQNSSVPFGFVEMSSVPLIGLTLRRCEV